MGLINLILTFSVVLFQKNVILHLEKIPRGITHTGISFQSPYKTARYDFRAFNENLTCLTTGLDRSDIRVVFPDIYDENFNKKTKDYLEKFFNKNTEIIKLDIKLGTTKKTFKEIENHSNKINKKYIFGIYDCRHYVDNFAVWAGVGNIPIWRLSKYFK